ncbi:MAG: Asp-tRNA(Asn)/Glu-tRNA(Gln) amidotransferase subunit GatA [Rickettsiales bacterium]|nr:Asp-tRNA(Asn)/Glu-tRNA(Gln) amidotransferase subunit GatA [Rickettsiales bacterium]
MMMTDLTRLTLSKTIDGLKKKQFSSAEVTNAYLAAIDAVNPEMNAYITVTHEVARAQAKQADARLASGEARPLEGVPIAVKDLFCTQGVLTTAASHILEGFVPPYESTVTKNLFDAGVVMLGKTNLDEFAMGSANITSYYGSVMNPWSPSLRGGEADAAIQSGLLRSARNDKNFLVPGGSSGGSAAAVAANLCAASLGTDTGGSIRQPASFCGIVGFKPSYGRCSRYGVIAFASSLDQAGPITKTVKDSALLFEHMAGHDAKDSTSSSLSVPRVSDVPADVKGLRIGIPREYRPDGLNAEVAALWDHGIALLKAQGAQIVDISLPHTKYALATYYIVAPAECSSNLARYDGVRFGLRVAEPGDSIDQLYEKTRAAGFGAEVKRRIMIGTYVLSSGYYDAYYKKAQRVRGRIIEDFQNAFAQCDVILTPTAPSAAFGIGESDMDPVTMYLNDVFTVPASLAGLPGLSLPAGLTKDGLPLGLQLLANNFQEETLFKASFALEAALNFEALASNRLAA